MSNTRLIGGLLAGWLLLGAAGSAAAQLPSAEQLLRYRPRQSGVNYDTPSAAELKSCKVELVRGTKPGSTGWLLYKNGVNRKTPLLRLFDRNGDRKIDIWSYYKDGLEVYREIDSNGNVTPDQYRWLNGGGMKWGIDANEDGKIDSWRMISSDETAREAFEALRARDFHRLQALMVTNAELQAMGLPDKLVKKIQAKLKNAPAKFQASVKNLQLPVEQNLEVRVEAAHPQCVPGESLGVDKDLFRHPSRMLFFPMAGDRFETVNTNEMLKVGLAWRLLDVPTVGNPPPDLKPTNPEVQKIMDELGRHDPKMPPVVKPGPNAAVVNWNVTRVGIIQRLIPLLKQKEREFWIKQMAENLSTAAIHRAKGETKALDMLHGLSKTIAGEQPGSNLAGYVTYRLLWGKYAQLMTLPDQDAATVADAQVNWTKDLEKFVQEYPKAADAADALQQLAMGGEFNGKEDDAKKYYKQLADTFPTHRMASKARGALRRLDLVGNPLELSGKTLRGRDFSMVAVRGKVVAVYYWASYCTNCVKSFEKLTKLRDTLGPKGFEIVTVNLDDSAEQARNYLQKNPLTAYHLYVAGKEGGMSSPLAEQYGIMGLPLLFLVGKDGNVINRSLPINDLEDAVEQALKK